MLKIPNRRKMPVSEQQPRIIKIERPTTGRILGPLKMPSVQQQTFLTKNNPKISEDLASRLETLQRRIQEWKSSGQV
ncbi:uncharacterized protein LOC27207860 [Drosophila simulans]|uniref:Uncharacterized protein n=1 Tax=Drosophila simulans TaxID=7240 RepID=A0A0J9RW58_DROSI|nr:uncharacterized protein LOC27207860 [Drosophila simulans]KMY99464.1 uncharacterized protein Dsimw501_GD28011 [Drosophila simulans]